MALSRRQGIALCIASLLFMSATVALAQEGDNKPADDGKKQEDFEEKLEENQVAQEHGEEAPVKLESKIVEEAPAAELASGTGDVSTTGACTGRACVQAIG